MHYDDDLSISPKHTGIEVCYALQHMLRLMNLPFIVRSGNDDVQVLTRTRMH